MKSKKLTVVKNNTHKVRVAKAMLRSCLQELKQRYGFFIYAINLFEPVAVKETIDLATDGKHLFFNASRLLEFYKAYGTKEVKRHIMHMLLHGIFGDFEQREEERWQKLRWSVMDFKVDEMLGLLGLEENERFWGFIGYYFRKVIDLCPGK